jgi:hypothetical protein
MGFFNSFGGKDTVPQNNNIKQQEISNSIIKEISESGYIKPEVLPELLGKIKKSVFSEIYSEIGFSALFSYNDYLTLEEKKSFGYPVRQKISREMIDSLSSKGLELTDPKGTLQGIYNYHSSIINRKYELIEMKKKLSSYDDFLLGYRVIAGLGYSTCIICGALDGTLLKTVKDVENYERHKCLNKICHCVFVPVIKGDEKQTGPTYAGWFKKLSVEDKKEILGEYYNRYKAGESLKDIVLSFNEETTLKYVHDLNTRIELGKIKRAKNKPKRVILPPLTEEQLEEFRKFYTRLAKTIPDEQKHDWVEGCVENVKTKSRKEQHLLFKDVQKKNAYY